MDNNLGLAAIVLMALVPFGDRDLKDIAIAAIAALTIPTQTNVPRRTGSDRPQHRGGAAETTRPEFSDL
jgi:hypothetical protein